MPSPLYFDGVRLPLASYANFYICNAAVIVPTFNDPSDRVALGILGERSATVPSSAFTPGFGLGLRLAALSHAAAAGVIFKIKQQHLNLPFYRRK